MSLIRTTSSLCPVCLTRVEAGYEEDQGRVYFVKTCPAHGTFRVLFWMDAGLFRAWDEQARQAPVDPALKEKQAGCPFDCGLCADHQGKVCTAVLEITNRCNLNCPICFAIANQEDAEPTLADIRNMYATAKRHGPDCFVQLSGGEPTLREDLPQLIELGKEMGFKHIQVNTNGVRLAREAGYAERLQAAGCDLIYLQFDGLSDDIYLRTRGRKLLALKRAAIQRCREAGLAVLLVPTVVPGINFDQLWAMVQFAVAEMPTVRGIHFQPVSYFGRFPEANPPDQSRTSLDAVITGLVTQSNGAVSASDFTPRERFDPHCAFSGLFFVKEDGTLQVVKAGPENPLKTARQEYARLAGAYTVKHWQAADHQAKRQSALRHYIDTRLLSLTGMGFQDAWNLDLNRLRGCCVHVITPKEQAIPLCAFHLTSLQGERLYTFGGGQPLQADHSIPDQAASFDRTRGHAATE